MTCVFPLLIFTTYFHVSESIRKHRYSQAILGYVGVPFFGAGWIGLNRGSVMDCENGRPLLTYIEPKTTDQHEPIMLCNRTEKTKIPENVLCVY